MAGFLLIWQFSYLDNSTELVDLWSMSEGGVVGFIVYLVALALMTGGWLWAIFLVRGRTFRELLLTVTGITILLYVAFLLVYPSTAIDVYIYAARSHLFSDYGLNPSTVTPREFWETDPYVQYASWEWSDDTSPYGPLWNVVAAPATAFDSDNIQTAVLLFKGIMALASIALGTLIYSIGRRIQPRYALSAALAWLWSPIVLWEGVAGGHNDVILMVLIGAAIWCWYHRHDGWIIPLLGAAALLKVVAVMLIPAAIVAIIARAGWSQKLLVSAFQTIVLSMAVLWIAFVPFYDLRGTIDAIQSQRDVWVTSPALLLDAMNGHWAWDLDVRTWYEQFSTFMIILLTVTGTFMALKRPDWLPRIAYEQLFWFLLLATSNLRPWYIIWLVALAVVLPLGMPFIRAAAWSIGALFSYGYTGWVQNWADPNWLERTSINLGITLAPVLLVMLWSAVRIVRTRWHEYSTNGFPSSAPESRPRH